MVEVKDFTFFKDLPNLTYLNLEFNEIEDISFLESLQNLTILDLGTNKIRDISVLKLLPKIVNLNLWKNNIDDFSPLKELPNLKILNLWNTNIENIEFVCDLPQLTDIDLRSNKIKDFSPLLSLKNLTKLNLGYTELQDASFLKELSRLTHLILVYNKIENIDFLRSLNRLQFLTIEHNKILELPLDFFDFLPNLAYLTLCGNPIKNIPKKLYERGFDNCFFNVKNYFKDLKQGSYLNDTLKVVFAGNGRTGKTSLMRVLQGQKFDENEETTHAIYLKSWQVAKDLHLNIWDFGGQHLYHTTHRLFLKTEAISILVWDKENSSEKEAFEINRETGEKHEFINHDQTYWLSCIKQLNKEAPIYLVQSKIDKEENSKETPPQYQDWKKSFNIVDLFHIDSKTERGVDYFRSELVSYAKKLVKEQPLIPLSWHKMRELVYKTQQINSDKKEIGDNTGVKIITVNNFYANCIQFGIDESSMWTLLDFLYQTGVVFYDQNLFSGQIILDQEWLIDAVYTLFDRKSIFYKIVSKGNGHFTSAELNEKWEKYSLVEKQLFIQYMQQCGICFEIKHGSGDFDKKEWVAPYLMSDKIPPSVSRIFQDTTDSIFLRFNYQWLFYGVIQSFIISSQWFYKVSQIWRNGVWLQVADSDALIQSFEKEAYIQVQIKGKQRKLLLDMIRNEFNNNRSFFMPEISIFTEGGIYLPLKELEKYKNEIDFTFDGERFITNDYKEFLSLNAEWTFGKIANKDLSTIILEQEKQEKSRNMEQFKEKIRDLIRKAKLDAALKELTLWANRNNDEALQADIDNLSSQLSGLKKKENMGLISDADARIIVNNITNGLLEILKDLGKTEEILKKETPNTPSVKSRVYISYAWGDDKEQGESREKIVQELYDSLKSDGYDVKRDKENIPYGQSIRDFMKELGQSPNIVVAISDKYLKSENCMFEMLQIYQNAKLDKATFYKLIHPIRVESIALNQPKVLMSYFKYWEDKEKEWEELIEAFGKRISEEQQRQYRCIKEIAHELGDFLAFLNDINAKSKSELTTNDFAEIKKAIDNNNNPPQ